MSSIPLPKPYLVFNTKSSKKPIEIKLTIPQRNVALSQKRFRINVAGRRSGKSYLSKFLIFQYE